MDKTSPSSYIGRFAPSPTGSLHFGSLIAAVASYIDAKAHTGQWLLRFEDVDTTRCSLHFRDSIRETLDAFGLAHDGESVMQTDRLDYYAQALSELDSMTYRCDCTRKQWHAGAKLGAIGKIYPRRCYANPPSSPEETVMRLALPDRKVCFNDRVLGNICYDLQREIGDPILQRKNADFAYVLAVSVDDALQDVTHIVRGVDLLPTTPIQRIIQEQLGYSQPSYLHFPLALDAKGRKLSKQNHAKPLTLDSASNRLVDAITFLGQRPPSHLIKEQPEIILDWAIENWQTDLIPTMNKGDIK